MADIFEIDIAGLIALAKDKGIKGDLVAGSRMDLSERMLFFIHSEFKKTGDHQLFHKRLNVIHGMTRNAKIESRVNLFWGGKELLNYIVEIK